MARQPALQKPGTEKLNVDINLGDIPEYTSGTSSGFEVITPGQPKRAWISGEVTGQKTMSLSINYTMPANGQPHPLPFSIWSSRPKAVLPINAISVRPQSGKLFLLSAEEFVISIFSPADILHGLPKRNSSMVQFDRPICQARMMVVGSNEDRAIVYTSRAETEMPADYYIIAVPPTFRKSLGDAIRIHDTTDADQCHYYAVPFTG
jgi:hypothetical protein